MNSFLIKCGPVKTVIMIFFLILGIMLPISCNTSDKQEKNQEPQNTAEDIAETNKTAVEEESINTKQEEMIKDTEEPESNDTSNSKKDGNDKTIVAKVNGEPIYQYELRGKTLDDVLSNKILYIEGLNRGLDEKFADQISDYKNRIITSAVRKDIFTSITDKPVTDEEMRQYYKDNREKYMHLTVKQISVKEEEISKEVRKKVLSGENFNDIASEYEDKGVNVFVKEFLLPTNYNKLFKTKEIGNISETQKGIMGYEIMKITQIVRMPFEKSKPAIRHNILSNRKAAILNSHVERFKEENNITIDIIRN